MSLNRIYFDILKEINNNQISINILVEKYKLTARALRYYIDDINYYLKKYSMPEIYIKNGKLYFNIDENALIDFIDKIPISEYLLSQEERKKYILFNFLFKNNSNISKLENFLNVSRTTIKNDINDLKKYLNNFDLYFYLEINKLMLGGNEKKLRHLKFLHMMQYINIHLNKINYIKALYPNEKLELSILKDYINKIDIDKISQVISEVEKKLKYNFSHKFKNIMSVYLIATLERIQNHHIINKKNNADFLSKLPEYRKIKSILNNFFNSAINKKQNYKYEILHLTEYFLSEYYNEHFYENKIISEKFILKILEDMNAAIEEELVDELMKYLVPAIYRIKNNFCIDDKLDFNNINIDIFNKVKSSVNNNVSYLQEPLRDEEIYYISKIIEKYIYPNNKISLKELVRIIDKNYYDKGILIEKIRKKFAGFIDNDMNNAFNYKISKILKKKNIHIIKNNISIQNILDNIFINKNFNEKEILTFNNIINEFGKYFFIKENIFLFSNIYAGIDNTDNTSSAYLIISDKPIIIDNKKANILFFIITNNKTEHLHIVSQIMKLSEDNFLLGEIIEAKTSDEVKKALS